MVHSSSVGEQNESAVVKFNLVQRILHFTLRAL